MELGDAVKGQLQPGDWWDDVHLCLQYRAAVNGQPPTVCTSYNGRTIQSPMCSQHPDAYFSGNFFEASGRGAGCILNWGILPQTEIPDWFKKVELCFRSTITTTDGKGKQCGGITGPTEICAPVGNYTVDYLDDTSNGVGCYYSWKIKAPTDSPLWFLNTQLCVQWKASDGDSQCYITTGDKIDRGSTCAIVNTWTLPVIDNTDREGGNCQWNWRLYDRLVPDTYNIPIVE